MSRSKKGVSKRMLSRLKALRPLVLDLRRRSLVARDFIKFEPVNLPPCNAMSMTSSTGVPSSTGSAPNAVPGGPVTCRPLR